MSAENTEQGERLAGLLAQILVEIASEEFVLLWHNPDTQGIALIETISRRYCRRRALMRLNEACIKERAREAVMEDKQNGITGGG